MVFIVHLYAVENWQGPGTWISSWCDQEIYKGKLKRCEVTRKREEECTAGKCDKRKMTPYQAMHVIACPYPNDHVPTKDKSTPTRTPALN
jgi:hypothetical protein